MTCKIMMYLADNEQGKFATAKLLTSRVVCESPESRRYHHAIQLPGGCKWTLQEVRLALSTMINGSTHSGGRWFWQVYQVHRLNARKFVFVTRDKKDV